MAEYNVKVKWGKEVFKDVTLNTGEDPDVFRAQLMALTGVPADRQKVVVAGKKVGETWEGIRLRKNAVVLLMGTAEDLPAEPVERPRFLEDMTAAELGQASATSVPSGLANLGNTCYLNSCVQVFRRIPALREALRAYSSGDGPDARLVAVLGQELQRLEKAGGAPVTPFPLINQLYTVFPDFAERKEGSAVPMQQDAEECFSRMVSVFDRCLGRADGAAAPVVRDLLAGDMRVTFQCSESEQEDASASSETFFKLRCHIGKETAFLLQGLKDGLQEHITKHSAVLGREAVWEKKQRIARLPEYLVVQLVRFYWKPGQDGKPGNRAKIVKPVEYPEDLDVYDLCAADLQEQLKPLRKQLEELVEKRLGFEKRKAKGGAVAAEGEAGEKGKEESAEGGDPMDVDIPGNTGHYQLSSIITHQGYSAEGGHYVAWTRDDDGSTWYLYDDEKVTPQKWETVKGLARSTGDGPIPYLLVYRTKDHSKAPTPATKK
eukprot:CAMPEP_0119121872 /NCGR_PEP_ID=MMETSP1310-20130426/2297_1 /TAXON_ID=464262 /ORGANISM="Genus nov. species nov., Strain RCC2339" /LENGTH=489 /DNA_ID=CAMNT_0007111453 /DNA_START=85 /DNA_END=1554 /DNA_ORIENTATION=+